MENPIKMDDLGENPPFKETPILHVESSSPNSFLQTEIPRPTKGITNLQSLLTRHCAIQADSYHQARFFFKKKNIHWTIEQ